MIAKEKVSLSHRKYTPRNICDTHVYDLSSEQPYTDHVHMESCKFVYIIFVKNLVTMVHLLVLGLDRRVALILILEKRVLEILTRINLLRIRANCGFFVNKVRNTEFYRLVELS
jgi:hypothetical protein